MIIEEPCLKKIKKTLHILKENQNLQSGQSKISLLINLARDELGDQRKL